MTDLSVAKKLVPYKPKNKVRFVTAASLFDGHDASINIMRRILQSTGSEVIHLGRITSYNVCYTKLLRGFPDQVDDFLFGKRLPGLDQALVDGLLKDFFERQT